MTLSITKSTSSETETRSVGYLVVNLATTLNDNRGNPRDREPILIDFACDHLGIAAALRRAFTAAANDRSDHDFDDLIRQLN